MQVLNNLLSAGWSWNKNADIICLRWRHYFLCHKEIKKIRKINENS